MPLAAWVLAGVALCTTLGGCAREEAADTTPESAAPAAARAEQSAVRYTIRQQIHANLPELAFTLVGDRPAAADDTVGIARIEIREAAATEPLQVIAGLDAQPPLVDGRPAAEILDMNFDGYGDFRLVQSRSAGPNTPYLNWLFDPARRAFVESRELNEIPSARFDADHREIRSDWRDGANRYGTDIYVFQDGRPILVRKEEKTYQAPGVYRLKKSRLVDGTWKTVEEKEVREPKGG